MIRFKDVHSISITAFVLKYLQRGDQNEIYSKNFNLTIYSIYDFQS